MDLGQVVGVVQQRVLGGARGGAQKSAQSCGSTDEEIRPQERDSATRDY